MDVSKRSRAERENIKALVCELVQEMYDVKAIAVKLNLNLGYTYGTIKELGFRKEFITAQEREQLRRQRYEERNRGGLK
jgi:hypothetical protein